MSPKPTVPAPRIHPAPVVPVTATTRALTYTCSGRGWPEILLVTFDVTRRGPRPCYVWRPKFAAAAAVR